LTQAQSKPTLPSQPGAQAFDSRKSKRQQKAERRADEQQKRQVGPGLAAQAGPGQTSATGMAAGASAGGETAPVTAKSDAPAATGVDALLIPTNAPSPSLAAAGLM